jgi:hypothetical protein
MAALVTLYGRPDIVRGEERAAMHHAVHHLAGEGQIKSVPALASLSRRVTVSFTWSGLLPDCCPTAAQLRSPSLWARDRPGVGPGLAWWFVVEPPAGIEPATHPYHGCALPTELGGRAGRDREA